MFEREVVFLKGAILKMRIWILNHYIVPPFIEEGHRHSKFAKELIKNENEVALIYSSYLHRQKVNLIDNNKKIKIDEVDKVNYVAVKTRTYEGNGKKRVLNLFDYFAKLITLHKKIEKETFTPDIIIASSVHPLTCIAGILLSKKYKIPCIIEIRDLWPLSLVELGKLKRNSIITKVMYKGEKWIYKQADSIIFTMEGGKEYIIDQKWENEINIEKVFNINNGVNLKEYNQQLIQYKYEDEDLDCKSTFKVIYAGSLGEANALEYILEAAKVLSRDSLNIKIYIYGDGTQRENLENYCLIHNITNVIFKGRVNKKFIPSILNRGDLNLFTAHQTGVIKYGISLNKLFDYLASGKPTLSNVKNKYDILEKYKCGYTVENMNAESLAKGILYFYNMSDKEYSVYEENTKKAAKDYDFIKLTKDLLEIIDFTKKRVVRKKIPKYSQKRN